MNCQAREIFVSKRYCTSFSSYKEGSYLSFSETNTCYLILRTLVCTEYGFGADLKRFFYSLANDWFVMDEKY